jgi:hypothetical protein
VTTYVQLALYPDPDEHFAYVAYVAPELEWESGAYKVVCPADGCDLLSSRVFLTFSQAWDVALSHRRELLDEWLQPSIPGD